MMNTVLMTWDKPAPCLFLNRWPLTLTLTLRYNQSKQTLKSIFNTLIHTTMDLKQELKVTVKFDGQPPLKFVVTVTGIHAAKAKEIWPQLKKVVRPIINTIGYLDTSMLAIGRTIHTILHNGLLAETGCVQRGNSCLVKGDHCSV